MFSINNTEGVRGEGGCVCGGGGVCVCGGGGWKNV